MKYVGAIEVAGGYKGRVYQYDSTGNKVQVVQLCPSVKESKEDAIDDAVEWCGNNQIQDDEYEIDFS